MLFLVCVRECERIFKVHVNSSETGFFIHFTRWSLILRNDEMFQSRNKNTHTHTNMWKASSPFSSISTIFFQSLQVFYSNRESFIFSLARRINMCKKCWGDFVYRLVYYKKKSCENVPMWQISVKQCFKRTSLCGKIRWSTSLSFFFHSLPKSTGASNSQSLRIIKKKKEGS